MTSECANCGSRTVKVTCCTPASKRAGTHVSGCKRLFLLHLLPGGSIQPPARKVLPYSRAGWCCCLCFLHDRSCCNFSEPASFPCSCNTPECVPIRYPRCRIRWPRLLRSHLSLAVAVFHPLTDSWIMSLLFQVRFVPLPGLSLGDI